MYCTITALPVWCYPYLIPRVYGYREFYISGNFIWNLLNKPSASLKKYYEMPTSLRFCLSYDLYKGIIFLSKWNNYNCHNIYWDPLIWLVKNGHLIALTCISFSNEPGPYSWGAGLIFGDWNYFFFVKCKQTIECSCKDAVNKRFTMKE